MKELIKPNYEEMYYELLKETEEREVKEKQEKREMQRVMYHKINNIYELLIDKKYDEYIKENLKKIEEIEETIKREQKEIQYIYQDINCLNDRRNEEKRIVY